MRRVRSNENLVQPNRYLWAHVFMAFIACSLLFRLWYVQVYRGDHYQRLAKNNRVRYIEVPAPRGIIYDRNGMIVLGNRPYFDLVYIPQFVRDKDMTFKILSRLLQIPENRLERRLRQGRGLPKFLPINLKRNLSLHEVATIESNKIFLPGIDIAVAPRRDYNQETPSHMVGYLGEISGRRLKSLNKDSETNPYRAGDLVGKQGLEHRWEKYLRGIRGSRLIQVDAFGRRMDDFKLSDSVVELPEVPPVPGSDLIMTLDMELQSVTRQAFSGKNGAVVVINPQNGEIMAMISEPGYDPNIFQGVLSADKYRSLQKNPFSPFLDKTTGGKYPPGSIYKAVIAAAALEEKVVTPWTTVNCPGFYNIGSDTIRCHKHSGHGKVNLKQALMKSCDVYFYHIGVELGVDRMALYAKDFGLGQKLGLRLNRELSGLIPTSAWKKLTMRAPWTTGETPPVAIGQGAVELTPLQMANLYATIANEGKVWRPYIVRKIVNYVGETVLERDPELIHTVDKIGPKTWKIIKDGLQAVVMDEDGTGKAAQVEGVTVAGKTGTAQVISLKRNITELDVSMKWKDHAIFAAFSPVEDAEIAVAVLSEHDPIGGGGKAAAPVAQKIIKAYWDIKNRKKASNLGVKTH